MTHDDEFIGRLESYLDDYEGLTPLPGVVRDSVRASLPSIKQSGPPRVPQRLARMTLQLPASARYGLAAAAVIAAVLIGASFLGGGSVGRPDESMSPSPSVAPTAGGPQSLVDAPEGGELLPAGEYYIDLPAYPARIEFQVPAGWWHWYDAPTREDSTVHAILVNSLDTTGTPNGSAWGLSFTLIDQVLVDPCDRSAGFMDSSVTASADTLADAFSSWADFPATVEDVTLRVGYSGKRVEVTRGESATCSGTLFDTPSGYQFAMELPSSEPIVNQFTLLDVEGSVLVIWTTDFPGTTLFEEQGGASPDPEAHVDDQDELHAILESIVIVPR